MNKLNQNGIAHVLLIFLATTGFLFFLLVSNTFDFRDRLFSKLFPKPPSHAATTTTLSFSTFVGGSGGERAQGVAVDSSGFIYIVGDTTSTNLPVTPGVFQPNHGTIGDPQDGWVAKLTPDGNNIVWLSYLGGSGFDRSYTVKVDSLGYVYVDTWTGSSNFPTTVGAYDRTLAGSSDTAITKITPDGSSIVWSTFVGGSGEEQTRNAMFLNSAGEVYISGFTDSSNFPTTNPTIGTRGGQDGFLAKLSANGSSLLFGTVFGGSGNDLAQSGIIVHSDGTIYTAGMTQSSNFPTTPGAYQTTYRGNSDANLTWMGDAFISRFSSNGASLIYSTYLGGSIGDHASYNDGLAVDSGGNAYLLGVTTSPDFPTTAGAYQRTYGGGAIGDFTVSKISADGRQLLLSTYIGGSNDEESSGIDIDSLGNVYIGGNSASTNFPVTADAYQSTNGGYGDATYTKLSPDFSTLLYSTYLGGSDLSSFDRIRELVLDSSNNVIASGDTPSFNFPTTAGAYDTTFNGGADAIIVKFTQTTVTPTPTPSPTPSPTPTPPPTKTGDINGDGAVNVVDFSIMLSKWGTSDASADLNKDGIVNVVDFSILLSNWGT